MPASLPLGNGSERDLVSPTLNTSNSSLREIFTDNRCGYLDSNAGRTESETVETDGFFRQPGSFRGSGSSQRKPTLSSSDPSVNSNKEIAPSRWSACLPRGNRHCAKHWRVAKSHWSLAALAMLLFLALCLIGISVISIYERRRLSQVESEATNLALTTGSFFADQLDLAILPLFSMSQFATELSIFQGLPDQIGDAEEPGSLPFLNETSSTLRNVTGVCDQTDIVNRFMSIADTIKKNAKMDGILANMQLAPDGVICLIHPLVNTEDFPVGMALDSSAVLGLDLLNDQAMAPAARIGIQSEELALNGPLTLLQCPECDPFFIARLPVVDERETIRIDGVAFPRWGFATILINWARLVASSGIHDVFAEQNMQFRLVRRDKLADGKEMVILTESDDFDEVSRENQVMATIATINNDWEMQVRHGEMLEWRGLVTAMIVVISLLIASLVYIVLVQKRVSYNISLAQEAKVETERKITAYFAHELRNPLSAVDSALQSMPNNLTSETLSLVESMKLCSSFMSAIMNNLLDARKIEEGRMTLRSAPLSLSKLLGDICKMSKPSVQQGVILQAKPNTEGDDWVKGDVYRLQQILTNILTNSIKYTSHGSITLAASWRGDTVILECRDTGPGIPLEEQAEIFERFIMRGGAPGSGLGLAISKQLVELMNGFVTFHSNPAIEPGTTCVIELPLERCAEPQGPKTDLANPIQEPIQILIADDIRMNRTMMIKRLQKLVAPNSVISEAATGEGALAMCNERTFDVMIVDQYMEEAGGKLLGTEAVAILRATDNDTVIIGCSGNDLEEDFLKAGANFVWTKPLPSNEEIIAQLRGSLSLQKKKS